MTPTDAGIGVPLLAVRDVHKRYAVSVLTGVDLDIHGGEVHALMGANGAGKSTLTRILCGLTTPEAGRMTLGGEAYAPARRGDAEGAGVQLVMQEPNLVGTLTVAEHLFLNRLPRRLGFVATRALHAAATAALRAVGLHEVDPRTPMHAIGVGQQQLVAVAAALARPCRILLLDEPTAALTGPETELLFTHIRRLRQEGIGILYISHRMDEIRRIGDRVTVLRDGRVVATRRAADLSRDELVQLMVGFPSGRAPASAPVPAAPAPAPAAAPATHVPPAGVVALRVEGLCRGDLVRDVSFEVRRGEVLGIAGLVGSGRTETLRAIFGADLPEAGRVTREDGRALSIRGPSDAVRAGIGMVPEDRTQHALLLPQAVRTNMTMGHMPAVGSRWWIDAAQEHRIAEDLRRRLDVRSRSVEQPVAELSGGNQQKVVIARWLLRDCDVLLLDEPTRGIDVGAKRAIHGQIAELAAQDTAVIVVSSELSELMAVCDRILVLSAGRVTGSFTRDDWSEDLVMAAAFAGYAERPPPRVPPSDRRGLPDPAALG
jgi:ribose transport system ATP-binding protein